MTTPASMDVTSYTAGSSTEFSGKLFFGMDFGALLFAALLIGGVSALLAFCGRMCAAIMYPVPDDEEVGAAVAARPPAAARPPPHRPPPRGGYAKAVSLPAVELEADLEAGPPAARRPRRAPKDAASRIVGKLTPKRKPRAASGQTLPLVPKGSAGEPMSPTEGPLSPEGQETPVTPES